MAAFEFTLDTLFGCAGQLWGRELREDQPMR
jgi:hypothetical protein